MTTSPIILTVSFFLFVQEADHGSKHDKHASMDDHIKKQSRKVEKLQEHLEQKIFKHMEL